MKGSVSNFGKQHKKNRFFNELYLTYMAVGHHSIHCYISTGASNRRFYTIFNKMFDHLETLLTIHRPKKVLSAGSLCGPLVPSPQSK